MTPAQRDAVFSWLAAAAADMTRDRHHTAIAMGAEELAQYIRERVDGRQ